MNLDLGLEGPLGGLESKPGAVKGVGPSLLSGPRRAGVCWPGFGPPAQDTGASCDVAGSDGCVYLSVTWEMKTFIAVALGWIFELCFPRDQAPSLSLLLQFTGSDPTGNNSHKRVT